MEHNDNLYAVTVSEQDAAIINEAIANEGITLEQWITSKVEKLAETQKKVNLASKLRAHRGAVKHFVLDQKLMSLEKFVTMANLEDRVSEYGGYGKLVQLYAQGGVHIPAELVRETVVAINANGEKVG
jgi:hypothetical protein